ncbi:MAG: glycosyltransferase family 4 protein, partial [Dysgonamonadaceae bacterium]|nr:glycosyltransferase family 4 protein [Dysgonamonadaceae bacterium]
MPLFKIDGIGVDLSRFCPVMDEEKARLRGEYGYAADDFILLYIAEFIPRKNHAFLLQQIPELQKSIKNLKLIFAGKGELFDECKKIAEELNIAPIIAFLGYRNDIDVLCKIADVHVAPSKQEGQGLNNIESMACGLPIVASKIRGHSDVITHGHNGFLFDLHKPDEMTAAIITLYRNPELRREMSQNNIVDAKKYSLETAVQKMAYIYN